MNDDTPIKRWTAKRKASMIMDIFKGKATVAEVAHTDLTARVKLTLERFPSYGYRQLACVLGENRKPIQRILQLKGWQVRKRLQGFRPRARSLPSITSRPDERWATNLTHVWCDRRGSLAVIIDHRLLHARDPRLASIGQWQQQDSGGCLGGSTDLSTGGAGARSTTIGTSLR